MPADPVRGNGKKVTEVDQKVTNVQQQVGQVRDQVTNGHVTPLRYDLDEVLTRIGLMESYMRKMASQ